MIANEGLDSFVFGTGRLLDDLVQYVYSGENCRLILMGDVAQLPPVMQTESPALNPETLRGYNLKVPCSYFRKDLAVYLSGAFGDNGL